MNPRFKGFGAFGTRRTASNQSIGASSTHSLQPSASATPGQAPTATTPTASTTSLAPPTPPVNHVATLTPPGSTSSTTSLPMNAGQQGLGRPPSYTYNPNAPRAASPLPPQQSMTHAPPPINTGGYPQGHPALGGQPPGYGGGYGGGMQPTLGNYGGRSNAVEVEGAGRSKAQLIVGIDFVSAVIASQGPCETDDEDREQPSPAWRLPLRQTPKPKRIS